MKEIYRKRGRVVRWENGVLLRIAESGIAVEDGATFRCEPEGGVLSAVGTGGGLEAHTTPEAHITPESHITREGHTTREGHITPAAIAQRIRAIVAPHSIERLIVAAGEAEHDCDGRRWSERSERVHLALVRDRLRLLIDLATFDLGDVERIARVLDRAEGEERAAPERLVLAPNVSAALLASAVPAGVTVIQRPVTLDGINAIDGKGFAIVETPGSNWYRPSYRVRPVRLPMHLEARGDDTAIDGDAPRAVALLAPPHGTTLRVLVDDGHRAWPATVRAARIRAVGPATTFYPYGAGSFGGEMML